MSSSSSARSIGSTVPAMAVPPAGVRDDKVGGALSGFADTDYARIM
ncbi:MAG TPA: hypothetical protein VFT93_03345 [Candidatus Eisenbacteria bacterium]|nr:hypothetical protein [Candidatus Eisenbacteria bacterium]